MELFYEDNRLTPPHISLYMALFQAWNINRFADNFQIDRNEIMKAAKIGSLTTYTKCIKQLEEWQYLSYKPTHNPALGSRVNLYSLCTTDCTSDCTTTRTPSVQPTVQHLYINNTNNINLGKSAFAPPALEDVLNFFKEKKEEAIEAEKFFNHFQSNGWRVGGKARMKDWQASAKNWMLNKDKFNNNAATQKHHSPKPGQLSLDIGKDYSEPL